MTHPAQNLFNEVQQLNRAYVAINGLAEPPPIVHVELDDSVSSPIPTVAELQMRLITAEQTVQDLTAENAVLKRELAAVQKENVEYLKQLAADIRGIR